MPLFLDVLPDIRNLPFINIDCDLRAYYTTPYQINYSNLNHRGFAQYGYTKYVKAANVFEEKDQG